MKVRFWGTRGSIATPGRGTIRFGGNTSCVEVTTDSGVQLILDCGTGARELATSMMSGGAQGLNCHILLGHTHWDHIQGFPFFSPAFVKGNSLAIYGPEGSRKSLHHVLAGQMEFTYFPVQLDQLAAKISYHDLGEGAHTIGGVRVATQFLNHPAMTVGYRIEADGVAVVYLVDHEPFSDPLWRAGAEPGRLDPILHDGDLRHARFMAGADLLIHDAQYTPEEYARKKNWGHSAYDYVVQIASAAGVRRVALTHHDPTNDDDLVAEIEQQARNRALRCAAGLDAFCACEGQEIVLAPQAAFTSLATGKVQPAPVAHRQFRILVVDDQDDMRELVVRALRDEQYLVDEASSGAAALKSIDANLPDLLVVDYKMPGMDGLEVTKAIRARAATRTMPVVMLTGMTDEPSTRAGFEAGVTDYVTKPFSSPQLAARVHAALARVQSTPATG